MFVSMDHGDGFQLEYPNGYTASVSWLFEKQDDDDGNKAVIASVAYWTTLNGMPNYDPNSIVASELPDFLAKIRDLPDVV